jgi:prevent-host-death family protein
MAPTFPPIRLPLKHRSGPNRSFWSRLATMTNIAVAEAKARFSELVDRANRGERFLLLRHGRPAAALVPVPAEPEPEPDRATTGLASLAGIIDWDEFPAVMEEVIASRQFERSRPAPTFD